MPRSRVVEVIGSVSDNRVTVNIAAAASVAAVGRQVDVRGVVLQSSHNSHTTALDPLGRAVSRLYIITKLQDQILITLPFGKENCKRLREVPVVEMPEVVICLHLFDSHLVPTPNVVLMWSIATWRSLVQFLGNDSNITE